MARAVLSLNAVAILRDSGERYVFLFDGDLRSLQALQRTTGRFAADPELDFDWHDAAIVSLRARELLADPS